MSEQLKQFLLHLEQSIANNSFIKLSFANKRNKSSDLKSISAKRISIKKGECLSFVYRHVTKDITKNYTFEELNTIITTLLADDFMQSDLYTGTCNYHLTIHPNGKAKLREKTTITLVPETKGHDKKKHRIIDNQGNVYLRELGILNNDWSIKPKKQDKYRQINKYVEIIDGIIRSVKLDNKLNVVDMGSGKGYLTFALYDYLNNVLQKDAHVSGVELREGLVHECDRIAHLANFENLHFKSGTIKDVELPQTDVLIALHACDTATDDAIYRGIEGGAKVIVCAPCCHKQIRKQMNPTNDLQQLTRFGILKERQAELVTDGIRALLLEAHGYQTKVFEFISTEHTPKNVLIVGILQEQADNKEEKLAQIATIKQTFGIQFHYLEQLLATVK